MNTQILTMAELENNDPKSPVRGSQRRFLCPECGGNKPKDSAHRSLVVNTNNGVYICHRCQTKGKLKEFWEESPKFTRKKRTGLKLMSQFSIDTDVPDQSKVRKRAPIKSSESLEKKMDFYKSEFLHSPGEMYLDSRGVIFETAQTAQTGYAESWEHWEKGTDQWILKGTDSRVVFPVIDENENLVAVHTRAIDENCLNSAKITKGDKSKGIFQTIPDVFSSGVIAIAEAPIDALVLQMCGIPAIALIGTSCPEWIYSKLSFKLVLIATDADQAGDKIAFKLEEELSDHGAKTFRLRPRKAKDWAEVLENIGIEDLEAHLRCFSGDVSDEERFLEISKLIENGRKSCAKFITNFINNQEIKAEALLRICNIQEQCV
jgi:DNA primase